MKRWIKKSALWAVALGSGAGAVTGCTGEALGSEFQLKPSLTLSEEFNDNVFLTAADRRSDFITRARPAGVLLYSAPSLRGDLHYTFDYRNYAQGSKRDEKNHYLSASGNAELKENFFYLELGDTLSRISLDVARDVTQDSSFVDQTDQNRATVSPYLLWHPGGKSVLKTGYRYTDIRYWGVSGNSSGIDKVEHRGSAELSHEPLARLSLSAGYAFSDVATDLINYEQHDLWSGVRYEYAENSSLFGGIGNSWQDFSNSRSASNLFWNAGISHRFPLLIAQLETRVQYSDDPLTVSTKETSYSARLEKPLQHGAVGLSGSYAEFLDTLKGGGTRRKAALAGFGRYEITPRLGASLTMVGDRVSRRTVDDFPYHFSGTARVSYLFNYDISAALSYSYADYRRELESASGARQGNRVVIEVVKLF